MARKLNWDFVDWQWWVIGMVGTGIIALVASGSFLIAGEMTASAMLVGGIILYIRRGVLRLMKRR